MSGLKNSLWKKIQKYTRYYVKIWLLKSVEIILRDSHIFKKRTLICNKQMGKNSKFIRNVYIKCERRKVLEGNLRHFSIT